MNMIINPECLSITVIIIIYCHSGLWAKMFHLLHGLVTYKKYLSMAAEEKEKDYIDDYVN